MDPVLLFALIFTGLVIYVLLYVGAAAILLGWIWEHLSRWLVFLVGPVLLFGFTYSVVWFITVVVNK